MRVVGLRAYALVAPVEPQGNSRGWLTSRVGLIVQLLADDGRTGHGEAYVDDNFATACAVGEMLAADLGSAALGTEPAATDDVHRRLRCLITSRGLPPAAG